MISFPDHFLIINFFVSFPDHPIYCWNLLLSSFEEWIMDLFGACVELMC